MVANLCILAATLALALHFGKWSQFLKQIGNYIMANL